MSTTSIPLVSALPQFGGGGSQDSLFTAVPALQNLVSSTGGPQGLGNVNSLAAANPQMAAILSLMSPPGGLNPQQAQQFGPMFGLIMALNGMTGQPGMMK